jgi:hypothetical protein
VRPRSNHNNDTLFLRLLEKGVVSGLDNVINNPEYQIDSKKLSSTTLAYQVDRVLTIQNNGLRNKYKCFVQTTVRHAIRHRDMDGGTHYPALFRNSAQSALLSAPRFVSSWERMSRSSENIILPCTPVHFQKDKKKSG